MLRLATLHSVWSAAQLAQIRAEASHPPLDFFIVLCVPICPLDDPRANLSAGLGMK